MHTDLLAFEDARARMLALAPRLPSERIRLRNAAGRVLARDLIAERPWPRFDHSTMDGYAIARSTLSGPGPYTLTVVGESRAGSAHADVIGNHACRIFTGAPIPRGADAVVPQERVTRDGDRMTFDVAPRRNAFIRACGEDLVAGSVALRTGTRLSAGASVLAAMLDSAEVCVAKTPTVALLPTGSELYPLGSPHPNGIPESISFGIASLAQLARAEVNASAIVADNLAATEAALEDAFRHSDVIITIGGVSVGDHDHVRAALTNIGVSLDFWRVAIKPGKPIAFGQRDGKLFVGLPGNPSSAMVTFALFVMPLLRAMQGDTAALPLPMRARLSADADRTLERLEVARASFRFTREAVLEAQPHPQQASGAATSLAGSDGLVLVPRGEGLAPRGTVVDAFRWSDF